MMNPATFAPLTVRVCRIPKRISGSGWRSSQATKPDEQRQRTPPNTARVSAASQPSWPAWVIA